MPRGNQPTNPHRLGREARGSYVATMMAARLQGMSPQELQILLGALGVDGVVIVME